MMHISGTVHIFAFIASFFFVLVRVFFLICVVNIFVALHTAGATILYSSQTHIFIRLS